MKQYTLKAGSVVKVHGIPVRLLSDVVIETETDLDLLSTESHEQADPPPYPPTKPR